MIRDEDVMKKTTGRYMKPHEKVLYILALIFGAALVIAGIVLIPFGFWIVGIVLISVGILEIIGVGLLLWTDGERSNKKKERK